MTPSSASARSIFRTNSLAQSYQEVFTVVLRTRFQVQRWQDAGAMRVKVGRMISTSTQNVRSLGYSKEATDMALLAIVGFLDESVLSSKDPIFADWAGRPLSEELFGHALAGEIFFRHVTDLLNRPESPEVADVLELHYLCLLLGFRGKYAWGDASEIHLILRRIREKMLRIRGPFALVRPVEPPAVPKAPSGDRWVRRLSIAALVLALVCLVAYLGFLFLLSQEASAAAQAALVRPNFVLPHASLAAIAGRLLEFSL